MCIYICINTIFPITLSGWRKAAPTPQAARSSGTANVSQLCWVMVTKVWAVHFLEADPTTPLYLFSFKYENRAL